MGRPQRGTAAFLPLRPPLPLRGEVDNVTVVITCSNNQFCQAPLGSKRITMQVTGKSTAYANWYATYSDPHRHQVIEIPKVKATAKEFQLHALECERCGTTRGAASV